MEKHKDFAKEPTSRIHMCPTMNESNTTVAKGATSIYLSNVVMLGLNTVYFVIIANILPTSDIGILAGMQLILFGAATLSNMSLPQAITSNVMLPQAVVKFIPEFLSRGEKGKAAQSFLKILIIAFSIALLLSASLFIFANPVSQLLFRGEAEIFWIQLLAIDTFVFSLNQVFFGGLVGLGRIPKASLFLIISFAIRFFLAALLVINGFGIAGVLMAFTLGDAVFLILSSTLCMRSLWVHPVHVPTRSLLSYSIPLLVSSMIIFGVSQWDKLFAFFQLGFSDLGVYNIAVIASTIGAFAPSAITTALVPSLSSLDAKNSLEDFRKLARDYTRYVCLIASPMSFGIASLSAGLVQIFGEQYLSAAIPATIMSIATGLTAVTAVYNSELLATRRTKTIMFINLGGLAVLALGLITLTPLLAFLGVALSRAIMTLSIALLLVLTARKSNLFTIDARAFRDSITASSIMGVILFVAISMIEVGRKQVLSLAILMPIGIVIYFVVLRMLRTFNSSDIEFIRQLTPRRFDWIIRIIAKVVGVK
ncbi:MAG TPA: polysaccharide biosynthesis C-terminal domain-containing protein [Nitrososphaerales archaeon]